MPTIRMTQTWIAVSREHEIASPVPGSAELRAILDIRQILLSLRLTYLGWRGQALA